MKDFEVVQGFIRCIYATFYRTDFQKLLLCVRYPKTRPSIFFRTRGKAFQ